MNSELLFQTVHSVNKISVNAAVTDWCYQFDLTNEEQEQVAILRGQWSSDHGGTKRIGNVGVSSEPSTWKQDAGLRKLPNEYWKKSTTDTIMRESIILASCYSRKSFQIRPDGEDEWGEITPLCREYAISRVYPQTKPLAAIRAGTIIGPITKVHVVKILDEYGLEVAIPSIYGSGDIAKALISRETERFVNENAQSQRRSQIQ